MNLKTACCTTCLSLLFALPLTAQEPIQVDKIVDRAIQAIQVRTVGDFWLGIMTESASDTLRAHLELPERLVVQHVVPESPAAKAGVQEHDILLRFGETEVHNLDDLRDAINKSGEEETKLDLIRKGKETTLKIKPSKAPQDGLSVDLPDSVFDTRIIQGWLHDHSDRWKQSPLRVMILGPGLLAFKKDSEELQIEAPASESVTKSFKITIKKSGDAPAQITVESDGEQWQVTADDLDALPKEIRAQVQRNLENSPEAPQRKRLQLREFRLDPRSLPRPRQEQARDANEDLRKEIEALKKAFEELRKQLREE